jgi:hypothetical protein
MTIDEAKKLLPANLKYPLPDGVLDNLINVTSIPVKFDLKDDDGTSDNLGYNYALLAALIELAERRERNADGRKELVQSVCDSLREELYDGDSEDDYDAGFDNGIKRAMRLMKAEVRE